MHPPHSSDAKRRAKHGCKTRTATKDVYEKALCTTPLLVANGNLTEGGLEYFAAVIEAEPSSLTTTTSSTQGYDFITGSRHEREY